MKEINIGNETFKLSDCSVFTLIKYKQEFGSDLYNDLTKLKGEENQTNVTDLLVSLTRILYILTIDNLEEKVSYDRFVQGLNINDLFSLDKLEELTSIIYKLVPRTNELSSGSKNLMR